MNGATQKTYSHENTHEYEMHLNCRSFYETFTLSKTNTFHQRMKAINVKASTHGIDLIIYMTSVHSTENTQMNKKATKLFCLYTLQDSESLDCWGGHPALQASIGEFEECTD